MESESLNILRSFSLGNALLADPQTDGQSLSSRCEDAYKNANLVAKGWLGFRLMTTFYRGRNLKNLLTAFNRF